MSIKPTPIIGSQIFKTPIRLAIIANLMGWMNIIFCMRALQVSRLRLQRNLVVKSETPRISPFQGYINGFSANMADAAITFKNALIAYASNLCGFLASLIAHGLLDSCQGMTSIRCLIIPLYPLGESRITGILNAIPLIEPFDIAMSFLCYLCSLLLPIWTLTSLPFADISFANTRMVILGLAFLTIITQAINRISATTEIFRWLLDLANRTYFRQKKEGALNNGGFYIITRFANGFIAIFSRDTLTKRFEELDAPTSAALLRSKQGELLSGVIQWFHSYVDLLNRFTGLGMQGVSSTLYTAKFSPHYSITPPVAQCQEVSS